MWLQAVVAFASSTAVLFVLVLPPVIEVIILFSAVSRQNYDQPSNQEYRPGINSILFACKTGLMLRLLRLLVVLSPRFFRSRRDLLLENLALRQQRGVFKQKYPQPRFTLPDKLFWVMLQRLWAGWRGALILVQPETVVRCHRAGFKLYWT